jgi:hypothetical protein
LSGFSAHWLDLRESLDAASRAADLTATLADYLAVKPSVAVIDLGAGTGANVRYAAPLLGGSQDWLLVEHDPALANAMEARMRGTRPQCRIRQLDLDLATGLDRVPIPNGALITASALLDLVSEDWVRALAGHAARAAASVWFTLNYDGRIECSPAEPEDAEVRELFNRHQRSDKGFGPALGPGAAQRAIQLFAEQSYQLRGAPSDWRIGADRPALQRALVEGWCAAACEVAPARAPALQHWLVRRQTHIDEGRSQLRVGHLDLLGLAP